MTWKQAMSYCETAFCVSGVACVDVVALELPQVAPGDRNEYSNSSGLPPGLIADKRQAVDHHRQREGPKT